MRLARALRRLLLLLVGGILAMLLLGPTLVEAKGTKTAPGGKAVQDAQGKRKPADEVARDAVDARLGPLIEDIGIEAAIIAGGKTDGLFLYAEVIGTRPLPFLFRDRGKTVKAFGISQRLRELVEQAWLLQPAGKRWAAIALETHGKAFDARLLYPEEIDSKQRVGERVVALMPKRFTGKKLVVDRKSMEAEDEPSMEDGELVDPDDTRIRT